MSDITNTNQYHKHARTSETLQKARCQKGIIKSLKYCT